MSYLLDTNVISELCRKTPDTGVVEWFSHRPISTLFLSVLTLGELRKGVEGISDAKYRMALLDWFEADLPSFFAGRILPIDIHIADKWGRITAAANRPLPAVDSLIGATAAFHGFSLVTRNVRNFVGLGLEVTNPWGSD